VLASVLLLAASSNPAPVRPAARDLAPYQGLGTWVDAYDFSPQFQAPGRPPEVTPEMVGGMADRGVRTIFLQAAKDDRRSPGDLVNPELLGAFLAQAHARGMRVVGWYLPTFSDLEADMRRLLAILRFRDHGHRFDGLGVDIEWRSGIPDPAERNRRLLRLTQRLRDAAGSDALAAIVLPPVLLEVVNGGYWPAFPWRALAPLYDVWLPMGYWTFRTSASGYRDGYCYTEENVRRLRANLALPEAPVHPIGGTDDRSTLADYRGFVRAVDEVGGVGGSIYDWVTTPASAWSVLQTLPRS